MTGLPFGDGPWRLYAGARHGLAVRACAAGHCVALRCRCCRRYLQDVVIQTFLWAGLALAWNIAGGYAGLISFGTCGVLRRSAPTPPPS